MNQESAGHCLANGSLFSIESLPFASIPNQSKLFVEYQQNPRGLQRFYPSAVYLAKLLMIFKRYAFASLFIALSFKVSKARFSMTTRPLMITVRTSDAFVA